MKIAIVAPSGIPFRIGGAENLWWGVLNYINHNTQHLADLIKLPSPELDFWELMDNHWRFSQLDLNHFDMVISGKYPSWMVSHPNHVCYMLHKNRGFYDLYTPITGYNYSETYITNNPEVYALQEFMRRNQGSRSALNEFYELLNRLRSRQHELPADAFQRPGKLSKEIVHFLDGIALAPTAIKKYAAISHNVAKRKDYFPVAYPVDVIYPPPVQSGFYIGQSEYLFTASRLEKGFKRVELLVEAMKYVKANIPFKIAGTGDDREHLKQLAGNDQRIEFLGFVNDKDLVDLYANAFAVLFVPYDEDYGYITVEAMKCGKPVITATDSGGSNEFVRNGETGYSVSPEPQAIAERIDYLCEHRQESQQMGLTAQKLVEDITWENAIGRLLGERPTSYSIPTTIQKPARVKKKRKKITVAVTFSVFPPTYGGQVRIFNLYRHLAREFDVELVTLDDRRQPSFRGEIAPGLWEIRVPMSNAHHDAMWSIWAQVGVPITDVMMPKLYHLTPDYIEELRKSTKDADVVVACHPYCLPIIREVTDKPIVHESQDVEVEVKKALLPENATGRELWELTHKIEKECCQISQLIMTCSPDDAQKLSQLYGIDTSKIVCIPNCVDLQAVNYVSWQQRLSTKNKLGLKEEFIALFIGSGYPPNQDAVRYIFQIAEQLPDAKFLIMGSVADAFQNQVIPVNLSFMGMVDDQEKDTVLGMVDVALNPMMSGSGTNLKMLDYFAAGVPVISNPVGARGLGLEHGKQCIIVELEQFVEEIISLRNEVALSKSLRIEKARQLVEQEFNWEAAARKLIDHIREFIKLD